MNKILCICFIIAMGIFGSWALLDCVSNTQEAIERNKANKAKVGQHVVLFGNGFLKTSNYRAGR